MTGARTVPEWIGSTPDSAVPPRVRLRVWERAGGRCQSCTRKIRPGEGWEADHIVALVNGGENRESNLQCLCGWCHGAKTKADVAAKAKAARVRSAHIGAKAPSRTPMPFGKRSRFKRRLDGTVVLRNGETQ